MKKLLIVFAHPDDEMLVRGTIVRYKKMGWQVELAFATNFGHTEGKLSVLTPGTLEDPLYRAMEAALPDAVITFDKTGINNDPDHIKVCYATTYAFQKYVSWLEELRKKFCIYGSYEEQWFRRLEAMITKNEEPRLYYVCVPASTVARSVGRGELSKESFDKEWRGQPDDEITTIIGHEYFILRREGTKEHFMGKNDSVRDQL